MKKKTWKKYIQKHWWKYILGLIIIFSTTFPLYVLIEMSLKEPTDLASRLTWPDYIYFDNYIKVLKENNMLNAYKNTLIVTVGTVVVEVFCGCLAAYPLARKQTRFNEVIRNIILAIMMVPAVSVLVGVYSILSAIGGINTLWALILITAAFGLPLSIFLYTNYITSIPRALDEAARIEGANYFQCFLHIILPQLKPVTVSVVIIKGVQAWNDYLYPSYILQRSDLYTNVLTVRQYFSSTSSNFQGAAACCAVAMMPALVAYIVLNKYFIKGAVDSAVK